MLFISKLKKFGPDTTEEIVAPQNVFGWPQLPKVYVTGKLLV